MKTKSVLIILLSLSSLILYSQTISDVPYEFPVKPGSAEWAAFKSGQEMLEACQIPETILQNISTKALAETCLNYPLFFEYTAYNNERDGIRIMIENFNGLRELTKRSDGSVELINIYQSIPLVSSTLIYRTSSVEADAPYKINFIELVLANDIFINKLDAKEQNQLKGIIVDKYQGKLNNAEVYSLNNITKTFLLGAVLMDRQALSSPQTRTTNQKNIVKDYIANYRNASPELISAISKIIVEK